jgi:hypothetical protein
LLAPASKSKSWTRTSLQPSYGSSVGQCSSIGGTAEFNTQQLAHGDQPVSVLGFVTTSQFWFQSFQNWQSEFLVVGAVALLGIRLRQRGSPESKPVAAPTARPAAASGRHQGGSLHDATGTRRLCDVDDMG